MIRLLAAVLCTVALARAGDDATVALNFQDAELSVLARFVSEVTGRNFIVDDRVRGKVTIISPTRITPEEAYQVFQSVLQVKGFTTVPSGAFTKIVPIRDARESAIPTGGHGADPAVAGGRSGDAIVTRILPVQHADAAALVPVLQPLVSKDGLVSAHPQTNRLVVVDTAANVDRLTDLLRDLDAPAAERGVEVAPLRFAEADDLAARLRETLGTDAGGLRVVPEARTNALMLAGPPADVRRARELVARLDVAMPPGATHLNVYHLKYADADGLVRVLAQLLGLPPPPPLPERPHGSSLMRDEARHPVSAEPTAYDEPARPQPAPPPPPSSTGSGSVPLEAPVRLTADPATNSVIVSATGHDWETLRDVIRQLDVRRRQVFVEAIVLEVTVDKMHALGLEFTGAAATANGGALMQVNPSSLLAGTTPDLGTGAAAGASAALGSATSLPTLLLAAASNKMINVAGREIPAYQVLLTALEADSEVDVLSAPNLVTTDNIEAEMVVGQNLPFVASRATSGTNLNNLFTTIERHDVGITLRLLPQITADDFVRLTLFEEVSAVDDTTVASTDTAVLGPTTTIRSASTTVAARDGQTVVIGGLLADAIRNHEQRVPYFGRIPVLGNLFKKNDAHRVKTNLLVFLTPHVLANDQQMADNAAAQRDRMPAHVRHGHLLSGPSWKPPAP
jgi:general secretion pathway protein D